MRYKVVNTFDNPAPGAGLSKYNEIQGCKCFYNQASLVRLGPLWGSDPLGMFPLFLERTADVLAPRLSVVFRRLARLASFTACWRQANVTPSPNGPPSSSVANNQPISII